MGVTFVLGRAGAGKTRWCLDALLAELAREDDRRLILLVPEQASLQMERTLALRAPGGGYSRAAVLSFTRLATRVFDETGAAPEMLGAQARALALRRIVAQPDMALAVLGRASATRGFFAELDRLIEEWLREGVTPAAVAEAAGRLDDRRGAAKVAELARLYAAYLEWLGPQRTDVAARLAVLRGRLERVGWLRDASLWVDGFAGFTGQELATLVGLARAAREVFITLLVEPASAAVRNPQQLPDALGLFQRTEQTYQRLVQRFAEDEVTVRPAVVLHAVPLPRFARAADLAALEAGLATWAAEGGPTAGHGGDVLVQECATHRDELRAAARWICTRLADGRGKLHLRDFAVIARDLEPLAPLVAEVFAEYGLPYFLDRRRPLRAHPLGRLIPALFAVVTGDFPTADTVRLLRTRLLPLSRAEAEQLENSVVKGAIRGAELWRQAAWTTAADGGATAALAPQRQQIMAGLAPLLELCARGTAPGAAWALAVDEALARLGVCAELERWIADARAQRRWEAAEMHRLAWAALCGILEDLHAVLGDTPLAAADVAGVIGGALAELTLGLAPPTLDQVLVSSIERSRHPDVQYAWLVAFNEGVFPARPADDLLLSTEERDALGRVGLAAPAAHRDDALGERLLAYIALTRAARGLVVSYATVGEDGGELLPSPLLADVRRALPGLTVQREPEGAPPACLPELARGYLAARRETELPPTLARYERLCAAVRGETALGPRLERLLRGTRYDNHPAALGNYRRPGGAGADVVWRTSPSEIETYLQCPYRHFARYGLRLDATRGPQPLHWDLGDVAHELLADVTRRGAAEPGGVRQVADERWQVLLAEAAQAFWARQPADLATCRPEFRNLAAVLITLLGDVVAAHAARWRRGSFEPVSCEVEFDPAGGAGVMRALEMRLADGGRVHVHGKIDRLDVSSGDAPGVMLVYDFKSKLEALKAPWLTGARLQVFLYLAAAQAAGAGCGATPGGVLVAPLYPQLQALETERGQAAAAAEQTMLLYRPRALVTIPAADKLDTLAPGEASTVAYLRRKKDGEYEGRSDVVAPDGIVQRLRLAHETVAVAAAGVVQGAIDVAPLVENRKLACGTCEFAAVCRFDRALNQARAVEQALPQVRGGAARGAGT